MPQDVQAGADPHRSAASQGRGCLSITFIVFLLLVLAAAGLFSGWVVQNRLLEPYETRIYPNVYALGQDLGGLTPEEASQRLKASSDSLDAGELILNDGQQTWTVPWPNAGLRFDVNATAQQAFAVGRDRGWQMLVNDWLGERYSVAPVFTVDPDVVRRALERLAPKMAKPPTDAELRLEGDRVVVVPGQPGRELDVEATLDKIVTTVNHLGPDYPFAPTFRTVPPRIADVSSAKGQAEEMLNREIDVTARGENEGKTFTWDWTLGRKEIARWLRVEPTDDAAGFAIDVDEEAVQASVANLAAEPEKDDWGFPVEETTKEVLAAFEAGGGEVAIELTPPPRIYVVQSGDRLMTIASQFGMPPGLIAELNPGVDLDHLHVGQELIIPPQDVLTPYDPVPGKKVVISIAEQRLRVYENGQLLYDWPCSTGIESSPTYPGHFQVLDKEEEAYASQWDLWMPNFIAIYRAGGDTYNGIHGLPTLSSGQRLWEGNLGSRVSYGCIVLGLEEAETLYNWAEVGVPVVIE